MKKCVILVTNKPYLSKCHQTLDMIIKTGNYKEDIVVIIGDDLKDEKINFGFENVIIKYFKNQNRDNITEILLKNPIGDNRSVTKVFQWHKLNCFDFFFKKWDVCFYIDVGMKIFDDINCFFDLDWKNCLIAHSDSYPKFEWKLRIQFEKNNYDEIFDKLDKKYNLDIDYFQTGIMLYDTNIIKKTTKKKLIKLSNDYYNSKTNEQGILNLYFNSEKKIWKPLPIKDNYKFYYDYWERNNFVYFNYRMLKYPKTILI